MIPVLDAVRLQVLGVHHVQNHDCRAWFIMHQGAILAKVYTCEDDANAIAALLEGGL